jgi:anti-sigma-K factor RskA
VCTQPHKCSEITLVAAQTHQVAGKVVVLDGKVWMQPTDMSANSTDQIYVLWQITGKHAPLAIGSFDVRTGVHAAIQIGGLAAPYSGTEAFAVSLEHGQTIPPAPSRVVAAGEVS